MLRERDINGGDEMKKLLSNVGEAIEWIWMTPEEARNLLRQPDRTAEGRDATVAYPRAA
jgi:hypothetical protein